MSCDVMSCIILMYLRVLLLVGGHLDHFSRFNKFASICTQQVFVQMSNLLTLIYPPIAYAQ